MAPIQIPDRTSYRFFYSLTTRWADNDVYGHVNNVIYYSYFDSVANRYLIEEGGLNIASGEVAGYVVSSGCEYHSPITYPDEVEAGLCVEKLGNSSVRYGIAIFRKGESSAVAHGYFVHVFVNRDEQKSAPIPDNLRSALEKIKI